MFDVPSAYIYFRGWPWGLALAVGLVVFPVLPVAWHVWSERKAKAAAAATGDKKLKPKKTTGIERFVFRTIVVAIVSIGGLIAIARGRVWTALKNDALWFIPESIDPLVPDSKLLAQVPGSAQIVVWVRPTDDAKALVGKVAPGVSVIEIVAAGREVDKKTDAVVIERGDVIIPLIEKMQATILGFTTRNGITLPEQGAVIGEHDGAKTWSTSGWTKDIGTGRAPVIDLMRRAPEDAFIVAVAKLPAKPSTPAPSTTPPTTTPPTTTPPTTTPPNLTFGDALASGLTVVAWIRAPREKIEADVTIEAADEVTAILLFDEAKKQIARNEKKESKGIACWREHSDDLYFRREGTKLHARLEIDLEGIKGMMNCLDMARH